MRIKFGTKRTSPTFTTAPKDGETDQRGIQNHPQYDPSAKVVAASSTARLTKSYNRFFSEYMKQLKKEVASRRDCRSHVPAG